jgi:hypothetical protein
MEGTPGQLVNRAKNSRTDQTGDLIVAWLTDEEKSTEFTVLCKTPFPEAFTRVPLPEMEHYGESGS